MGSPLHGAGRDGNAASVRLETPWFVDYFHMGRFEQRWVIVNALWYPKPKAK